MDFLGLRNMTIERLAIDSINERFADEEDEEVDNKVDEKAAS